MVTGAHSDTHTPGAMIPSCMTGIIHIHITDRIIRTGADIHSITTDITTIIHGIPVIAIRHTITRVMTILPG